ncbi:hypothetical protein H9Y05_10550 [Crocinitomicaceae bacterium CZZ-1]|uniref:Uncharacterized protein n=1 Tax=Taishania pollutisoli TaxID=2766479 RepID=A0A8J6U2F3_9FLAO|nr:hypothetical protein [Taishania pollutisoli]MBC9812910.1 hypothetical protein [Taishania pollutisoli]
MEQQMKKIGVIGAGWLGNDLVNTLSADRNKMVVSTTRSEQTGEFQTRFRFEFGDHLPEAFIEALDVLFITATLPKDKVQQSKLLHFVNELHAKLPEECRVVFTSTIGVYQAEQGTVAECCTEVDTGSVYYRMEQELLTKFPGRTTILRLGGLIGPDRHPVFSLSGRTGIADGQKPVNLVHKQDILKFMKLLLEDQTVAGAYNLVYPDHPSRESYYTRKAMEHALPLPEFETGTDAGKIVASERSQQVSGFNYQWSI